MLFRYADGLIETPASSRSRSRSWILGEPAVSRSPSALATAAPPRIEQEFRREYEAILAPVVRRRFLIWGSVWAGWSLILLILSLAVLVPAWRLIVTEAGAEFDPWSLLRRLGILAIAVVGTWIAYVGPPKIDALFRLAFWMLVASAIIAILMDELPFAFGADNTSRTRVGLARVAGGHFLACAFLPWRTRQALRAALGMWLAWLVIRVLVSSDPGSSLDALGVILSTLLFVPGLLACWLRSLEFGQRIEARVLHRLDDAMMREWFDAARIHEALFPKPRHDGAVRFDFVDVPRAGLGGDYLHASIGPDDSLNLVLLDVSGDGIAAALTVNRLHGELERLFGERPDLAPHEAVEALNRYTYLTLSRPLGIYAASMCVRISPAGDVYWAGAGHAPAVIVRADESVDELESTTWFLGATPEPDSINQTRATRMGAGDVLVLYSDGAVEQSSPDGVRLGFAGIRKVFRQAGPTHPLDWPQHIQAILTSFRGGPHVEPQSDTLVVAACCTR